MNYLNCVQKGVDFVENNLDFNLTLADVAQSAGLSQWHFQRIFKALSNETLKSYIRGRRLTRAKHRLLHTQMRIIDIALMAGFETQESFSRAFKAKFKLSPKEFRLSGDVQYSVPKFVINKEYLRHLNEQPRLEPELVEWAPQLLVGLSTRYYGVESEKNNIAETLPPLWDAFLGRLPEIDNKVADTGYGIVNTPTDTDEQLIYTACFAVSEISALPDGMQSVPLAGGRYAVFEHKGDARKLDHTVNYIYSNWLLSTAAQHSGAPDIEIYGEKYNPASEQSVIHYAVPIAV